LARLSAAPRERDCSRDRARAADAPYGSEIRAAAGAQRGAAGGGGERRVRRQARAALRRGFARASCASVGSTLMGVAPAAWADMREDGASL
jgi:hypothetical protein